jgi:hypothetical protein
MTTRASRFVRWALAAAFLAAPSVALGYGVWLHYIVPAAALKDFKAGIPVPAIRTEVIAGATDADLARFRTWFYSRAAGLKDTVVRRAFLKRYPNAAAFDEKAFKVFLMMNPEAKVLGVDSFAAVYRARTPADAAMDPTAPYTPGKSLTRQVALQMGSVYPDIDRRNQDRLYRTPTGRIELTTRGDTVPMDPMTLNWGNLTGLSSQAHAHIGLNHEKHNNNPATLALTPWNFVADFGFPTDSVESYGEVNAQLYTDLSYLAMLSGGSGSEMISTLFGGNAMHYIADAGNQIHTLQAGIKDFYSDATWQYWLSRLKTVFGLFGSTPSRNSIGLDILTNYHTLSETLFQSELQSAWRLDSLGRKDSIPPAMAGALQALRTGDPGFKRVLDAVRVSNARKYFSPEYGRLIAGTVIDSSFQEGAELYRLTRTFGVTHLRKVGVRVDFDTIPASRIWEFIRDRNIPEVKAALDTFNIVEGRGLGRVNVALNGWWDAYLGTGRFTGANRQTLIDLIVYRIVVTEINYLTNADTRRDAWIQAHGGVRQ